ncbi:MAG: phospho-N-acetylmuramoyl-pentapeptide-transferase [Bacteroidales bacterium]|nr:phospho-N-acetylmuramoyl-pentapeptide-transferase [Bacteroidales bacterium]MBR3500724.1 phospho-N-acetylmuramoyl-pentapeptide-transferase [Bacteroidales bacterium]
MLYYLFELLKKYDIPGQGLMTYFSFRAILANVIAIIVAYFFGKRVIKWLQKRQIGETVRNLGLEGQMSKAGTPTMGGVIIIVALLVAVLLVCDLSNVYVQLLILTTVWCGGLGFADDYIKVFKHDKNGLSEGKKLIGQFILGIIIAGTVCFSPNIVVRQEVEQTATEQTIEDGTPSGAVDHGRYVSEDVIKSTKTTIPFVKSHEFDYKYLIPFKGAFGWYCRWALYALVIIFIILACSNGANLTDGMDGLSAGTSAIVGVVIGILAWLGGNVIDAGYLNIMYIPGSGETAVFMAAFVGALVGFLWFNTFPAQVFMGDTGSLMIGGVIGVSAVLIRKELLLPILCGIFLAESLSVILQRGYFRYTKRKFGEGRRLFLMAPLHHHYQKQSIPEPRIVVRFWLVGIVLAVGTLALLKIR